MAKSTTVDTFRADWAQRINDYYELCKPRVVMLIVFTAIVGMLLATPGLVPLPRFIFATVGIALMAGSAAAINQILDRRADARMARTKRRPLVTGNLDMRRSTIFAATIGLAGMAVLFVWVNALTAWLTLATLIGYAGIYTVYPKRATPQNIVIGGASGATPPILGWAAMTGTVSIDAVVLFLIIFIWTPPHFWALAIERYAEYAEVDIPMLPVTHGIEHTRTQVLVYSVVLFVASLLPFAIGMTGWPYLLAAIALSGWFVVHALRLKFAPAPGVAMRMFGYSIVYLMLLFSALLLDHYVSVFGRLNIVRAQRDFRTATTSARSVRDRLDSRAVDVDTGPRWRRPRGRRVADGVCVDRRRSGSRPGPDNRPDTDVGHRAWECRVFDG